MAPIRRPDGSPIAHFRRDRRRANRNLYAPTDNLLILNLIDQATVAVYTPAVQIDSGALLLAGALASVSAANGARPRFGRSASRPQVLHPRHACHVPSSAGSARILWLVARFFRLWLGNRMDARREILPLMLIHTVIGGSSAVAPATRGAEKWAFVLSEIIAGIVNVALSFTFVRFCHLGLRGIILGTIVAVTGRCATWMPWYTLRVLKRKPCLPKHRSCKPCHRQLS